MRAWAGRLIFGVNVAMFAALSYMFYSRGFVGDGFFTSVELVTIVLTALSVIITALGIGIGLLAIWGYQSLQALARETAEKGIAKAMASVPELVSAEVSKVLPPAGASDYGKAAASEMDHANAKK